MTFIDFSLFFILFYFYIEFPAQRPVTRKMFQTAFCLGLNVPGLITSYPYYHNRHVLITPQNILLMSRGSGCCQLGVPLADFHDDVNKWKHFPRYCPFVRGIHRSPVNPPHKGQWRGTLMFSLIFDWLNSWVNNREAGHLRRYRTHCDVIVMSVRNIQGII